MNYQKAYEELVRMLKNEVHDTERTWPHKNRGPSIPTVTLKAHLRLAKQVGEAAE